MCDKLTAKKPGFCGIEDCDPRRDQTCDVIDCRQSPRALDILEGGTGHVLRAFYFFLSSFGDGPSLKKDYPLSSTNCIMHSLKRLSPFGELKLR